MGFAIHFQDKQYSLVEFLSVRTDQEWVKAIQRFCNVWENNLPFVFNSSGSTGIPKAITFNKAQIIESAQNTVRALDLKPIEEHFLLVLNANFVGGAMLIARALVLDCALSIYEPSMHFFEQISDSHPYTFASMVPLHFQQSSFSIKKYERIKTVLIGGANIPKEKIEILKSLANTSFHTYGMTETLSNVALRNLKTDKGFRPIAPNQIRMNEANCICVRTKFLSQEVQTNDLAEWVEENCFKVLGRSDFMINSGGIKNNPEVIEAKILASDLRWKPNTFFIGKAKHPVWGEEIVMVYQGNFTEDIFEKLKQDFIGMNCKKEIPKRFLRINEFPISKNGKIERQKLNEWIENQLV